jgi:hypothetical protein
MKRKWLAIGIILLFVGTCVIPLSSGNVKNQDFQDDPLLNVDITQNTVVRSNYDKAYRYTFNGLSSGDPLSWWDHWLDFPGRYEPFFKVHDIIDFGQTAWGLTSADFNKDGGLDFAVSWATSPWTQSTISLYYNNGNDKFTREDVYTITQPDATYFESLNSGDYNNDGFIDLMYTYNEYIPWSYTNGTVNILFNDGTNHFDNSTMVARLVPIGAGERINPKVTSADFDKDGDLDFLVGDNSGMVEFYKNDGTGHFSSAGIYDFGGKMSWGLSSADFNNDGNIDFIVTENNYPDPNTGYIYLVLNDGTPSCFNQSYTMKIADIPPSPSFFSSVLFGFGCLCSIDYNNDGLMDFVFAGSDSVFLYMQNETGAFDYFQLLTLPMPRAESGSWYIDDLRSGGITAGDFNGDGLDDMVIGGVQGVARICYNQRVFVDIIRPDNNSVYVSNVRTIGLIPIYSFIWHGTSVAIGDLTVVAKGLAPLQKVEFYLGLRLMYTDYTTPYEWNWTGFSFGRHKIKAVPYDMDGKKAGYDDAIVWKYF